MSILKENVKEMLRSCYYKNPLNFLLILNCETCWKRLWVNEKFNVYTGISSDINPPEFNNKLYFGLVHDNRINPVGFPVTLLLNQALNIPMRNQ